MNDSSMTRRQAIKSAALAGAAIAIAPSLVAETNPPVVGAAPAAAPAAPAPFFLPKLDYAYDALEPHIDAQTMEIHHSRHHKAYVDNLNKLIASAGRLEVPLEVDYLVRNLDKLPENIRTGVRNQGGGHYNHLLFWQMLKPGGSSGPSGELAKAIDLTFGNLDNFKAKFTEAATKVFGSGWAWLILEENQQGKRLFIETAPNQDMPLGPGRRLVLGVDVWEHAYYLKHQNKRADYLKAWWNVVNWDYVVTRFDGN